MIFDTINTLAKKKIPFLFVSDFRLENIHVIPLDELEAWDVEYSIDENYTYTKHRHTLQKEPLNFELYQKKMAQVIEKIKSGETYLLNLTQATKVIPSASLQEIFKDVNAHYKLRYKDQFLCFSPEKFIQIKNNKIHTFPMKGTIDAALPNAAETILANEKEMAEHIMVVDLLRNDLSMVASDVRVQRFRYIDTIEAGAKKLLQVSSHISGDLGEKWQERLGSILQTLLPAGSISGTPKKSTLEIIDAIEGYERGYFSGVFGVFNGESFDSGVMIRFLEKTQEGYVYKSGGGITLESDALSEYQELLDKVYLP
ncbi:MAG: aminodeoxychorismate synthase component I [Sulfurimonas sp.]|jgi:para-aminobenzoate synthetase component 1|nr:aminodeoxychorismate synthase component I [Sulfurimonas sp.]